MQKIQINHCDDEDRIPLLMQKIDDEYIHLGKCISHLVQDAGSRIDSYTDEIIEIKQKREGKN